MLSRSYLRRCGRVSALASAASSWAESSAMSPRCFKALPGSRSGELDIAFPRLDDTHLRVREETTSAHAILIG
jgi:hypothetical protein